MFSEELIDQLVQNTAMRLTISPVSNWFGTGHIYEDRIEIRGATTSVIRMIQVILENTILRKSACFGEGDELDEGTVGSVSKECSRNKATKERLMNEIGVS